MDTPTGAVPGIGLLPEGMSHWPDLSALTPEERRKHHLRAIKEIRFTGSPEDVRAYQARYPETAGYVARSLVTVSAPKPPGYADAVARMVAGWLTSTEAAAQTNKADVIALNAALGCNRFDPANFLNRPAGKRLRERLGQLFEQRGYVLPKSADTLAKVKLAAKAARAGTLPDATAFGTIGTLAGDTLTIGSKSFRIVRQHGHSYVRLYCGGGEARLRVDVLREFLGQTGLLEAAGEPPPLPLFIREGESGSEAAVAAILPGNPVASEAAPPNDKCLRAIRPVITGTTSATGPILPGNPVSDTEGEAPPSLAERIKALAAVRQPLSDTLAQGADPLELP